MTKDFQFLHSVKKMPLMSLPVQSTIVQLSEARLIISPGSQLSKEDLLKAGAITDIIAPNLLHCAGITRAKEVFPKARVWGPPSAREKKPKLPWDTEMNDANWPFKAELPFIALQGTPSLHEHLFFHVKSKSLIVTDFIFNIQNTTGFGAWLILHAFGTYHRPAMSRLYAKSVQDKAAFEKSLQALLALDFKNVIVSHGENLETDPKALRAMLQERGFLLN